ncbi:MAG: 4Fe-4S dicluster domain-containing protein [Candidatus Stygibacter australis]|nr:4Fe-4S dicluster domain-containing protein [Candidatus Stygibacter australis]MDP8321687.1 4Fe-4S dicluster domain-containing protein [Candidatus Stygibacter australis]
MDKIILKEKDANFKNEIAAQPGAEHFKQCFTCGTCTAACPVAEVHPDYDPRKIIRMTLLGLKEEVLTSDILWMCSRCYTCYALCPQGVKFTDVIGVLRDMAIRQGYVPKNRNQEIRELDKFIQKLRTDMITTKLHPEKNDSDEICKSVKDELSQVW